MQSAKGMNMMDQTSGVRILIGADIVPTVNSEQAFAQADMDALVGGGLKEILESADMRFFNLEVPLADQETPISKCGPALRAPTSALPGIRALNPTFLTLANNHIMDQGQPGLQSTTALLDQAGIAYGGVGDDLQSAEKSAMAVLECKGVKAGIYACAEHEFSIAGEGKPGANPYDPLESYDHVEALKKQCDYVIVLYHGGKEYYRYPSPNVQKVCRKFIRSGADLVICQHTHCVGCEEKYQNGTIVYGQGNFLFDKRDNEFWNTSILVDVRIVDGRPEVSYIPLQRATPGVKMAEGETAQKIMEGFLQRSEEIKTPGAVEKRYSEFAKKQGVTVLSRLDLVAGSFVFHAVNKLCGGRLARWYFNKCFLKKKSNSVLNAVECEAWRELLITALKDYRHD